MALSHFEDYEPGAVFEFGPIHVDESEIVDFGKRFDPQTMHTDPDQSGLIASGWHTASLMMRLLVENFISPVASFPSPGVDELRWLTPVRPGDDLRVRVSILSTRPSRTKPDRGLVFTLVEALNQNGVVVCSFKAMNFVGRKD